MSGILLLSDKEQLASELRSAADKIAQGAPIKMLVCEDTYDSVEIADSYKIDAAITDAATLAEAIAQAAKMLDCDTILLSSNRRGRELSGRLAQKLDAGVLTGVSALELDGDDVVALYPSLGGAVVDRSKITTAIKIFALAPNSFDQAEKGSYTCENLAIDAPAALTTLEEAKPKEGSSVDISAAETLVIVGAGIEEQSYLSEIEDFAASMNAVIACTKPVATDRKWLNEDCIVGISGKICKPTFALALGVSGQVQFWAGIRDAGTVVSINTDENAYIVELADASVVCDAMEGIRAFKACL